MIIVYRESHCLQVTKTTSNSLTLYWLTGVILNLRISFFALSWSEAVKFFDFSNTLGWNLSFYTTAWVFRYTYCLNALFYLYQTKSKFRPTSSHWISTFYSSLESLEHEKADCTIFAKKFCVDIFTDALKENFLNFSFYFLKMYNLAHFFFLHIFL